MRGVILFLFLTFIIILSGCSRNPELKVKAPRFVTKTNNKEILTTPSVKDYPTISLERIFDDSTPMDPKVIKLIATGDYIVARSVNYKAITYKDFTWPVKKVASFLSDADITLINLENPLLYDCPVTNEGFKFCGSSEHVQGLVLAGVDVANIANNHYGNYGIQGVTESNNILSDRDIKFSGSTTQNITYINIDDTVFSFLGYNDIGVQSGVATAIEDNIISDIPEAKKNSNVVIVSFHWGVEYTTQVTSRQKELAHLAIDAGADLIIGNHPHWIQPLEIYNNKLIVYAHGNFIFDQMWSEETKKGVIGEYFFYNGELIDADYTSVYIQDYGQVDFADETMQKQIIEELYKNSLLNVSKQ